MADSKDAPRTTALHFTTSRDLENEADLPPVVARMVVEIRSDGSRTVARGALEDLQTGERVALTAGAGSPLELARELSKSLFSMPVLATQLAKESLKNWAKNPIKALSKRKSSSG